MNPNNKIMPSIYIRMYKEHNNGELTGTYTINLDIQGLGVSEVSECYKQLQIAIGRYAEHMDGIE